jgi:hypothetical protein
MGIDGNKIADELARQGSLHPLTGPQPVLGISAKVARGVITDWTSRKHEEHWQSIHAQGRIRAFLKKIICKKSWGIIQPEQKPAKNNDRAANRTVI